MSKFVVVNFLESFELFCKFFNGEFCVLGGVVRVVDFKCIHLVLRLCLIIDLLYTSFEQM